MKKFVRNNLKLFIGILLGIIISGGIVYAINANSIEYTPQDENWNVNGVTDALNDLYLHTDPALMPVLLWTNPNPTAAFAAQTLEMNLSEYKYLIVVINATTSNTSNSYGIVPINNADSVGIGRSNGSTVVRHFQATSNSVIISAAKSGTAYWNSEAIPYKIYGIKGELGIDVGSTE